MDYRFSQIIKKSNLGIGSYGFLESHRAAVLARTLRIFAPKEGYIFVNDFDGRELLRMGEITRRDVMIAVRKLSGGSGYEVNFEKLNKALVR